MLEQLHVGFVVRVSSPLKTALQKVLLNILVNSSGRFAVIHGNSCCTTNSSGRLFLSLVDLAPVSAVVLQRWVGMLKGCPCFGSVPAYSGLQALVRFFFSLTFFLFKSSAL